MPHPASTIVCTSDAKLLITGGYWDNSIKVSTMVRPNKVLERIEGIHHDVVTCLAVDETDTRLVSGGRDSLVAVWALNPTASGKIVERCLAVLAGLPLRVRLPMTLNYTTYVEDIVRSTALQRCSITLLGVFRFSSAGVKIGCGIDSIGSGTLELGDSHAFG